MSDTVTVNSDTASDAAAHNAKLQQDIEHLKAELAKVRGDLKDVLSAAKDVSASSATTIKDKVGEKIDDMKEVLEAAKEKGGKVVEKAQTTIQERPLTSVLIAFGVGVLVAKLLSSRR